MRDLEWSYREPPIQPLWKRLWEGLEPVGEVLVLTICVCGVYYLAALIGAL